MAGMTPLLLALRCPRWLSAPAQASLVDEVCSALASGAWDNDVAQADAADPGGAVAVLLGACDPSPPQTEAFASRRRVVCALLARGARLPHRVLGQALCASDALLAAYLSAAEHDGAAVLAHVADVEALIEALRAHEGPVDGVSRWLAERGWTLADRLMGASVADLTTVLLSLGEASDDRLNAIGAYGEWVAGQRPEEAWLGLWWARWAGECTAVGLTLEANQKVQRKTLLAGRGSHGAGVLAASWVGRALAHPSALVRALLWPHLARLVPDPWLGCLGLAMAPSSNNASHARAAKAAFTGQTAWRLAVRAMHAAHAIGVPALAFADTRLLERMDLLHGKLDGGWVEPHERPTLQRWWAARAVQRSDSPDLPNWVARIQAWANEPGGAPASAVVRDALSEPGLTVRPSSVGAAGWRLLELEAGLTPPSTAAGARGRL